MPNSPQDCSPRHCGAVALFDFSSPNPKRDPCVGTRHRGLFLERLMGVEPTSSAWKADVLPLYHTRITNVVKRVPRDGIEPPTHALDWNEIAAEITNMICVFISLLYHLSYLAMWHVLLICKDVCAIALIGESWI